MEIDVDYRETEKVPLFRNFISQKKTDIITGINVKPLQVSDVCTADGVVGIERKAGDFVQSIYNEQLDKQLRELTDNFDFAFLFVEYDGIVDIMTDNKGTNPKVIIGALTSVLARNKVTVMFTGNYGSIKEPLQPHPFYIPFVVRTIEKIYDGRTVKKASSYTPLRRKPTSIEIKRAMFVNVFPNLGEQKVKNLFEYFDNSIKNIASAPIEELVKVKGIGESLAKRIQEVLN